MHMKMFKSQILVQVQPTRMTANPPHASVRAGPGNDFLGFLAVLFRVDYKMRNDAQNQRSCPSGKKITSLLCVALFQCTLLNALVMVHFETLDRRRHAGSVHHNVRNIEFRKTLCDKIPCHKCGSTILVLQLTHESSGIKYRTAPVCNRNHCYCLQTKL